MKKLFLSVAAAALVLGGLFQVASADEQKAQVGTAAPAFSLKGIDGKDYTLESLKGKVVVLEWFNPTCPYVIKHHQKNTTMKDTWTKFKDKDVVWLAVATGKTADEASLKKAAEGWKIEYPILLDPTGDTGNAYGAKTTPHMYVINKEGVLVYAGAIDNNKDANTKGDVNYVEQALTSVLAGEPVKTPTSKPYGCSVKYASNK